MKEYGETVRQEGRLPSSGREPARHERDEEVDRLFSPTSQEAREEIIKPFFSPFPKCLTPQDHENHSPWNLRTPPVIKCFFFSRFPRPKDRTRTRFQAKTPRLPKSRERRSSVFSPLLSFLHHPVVRPGTRTPAVSVRARPPFLALFEKITELFFSFSMIPTALKGDSLPELAPLFCCQ